MTSADPNAGAFQATTPNKATTPTVPGTANDTFTPLSPYTIDISPDHPPDQKTLVYSPNVQILIARNNTQYDVSNDIVACSVQRNENSISTLTFKLSNKNKRYNQLFERMDRVVCLMKRITWVQVFSGYLDRVPHVQLYPGTVNFVASCTLKRLAHTWWDPGLPASSKIFDQAGRLAKLNETNPGENLDAGLGSTLRTFLVEVGGWSPLNIHIQRFPASYFLFMQQQLQKSQKGVDDEAQAFKQMMLGDDTTLGTWQSAGVTVGTNQGSYNLAGPPDRMLEVIKAVDGMGMGPDAMNINAAQGLGTASGHAGDHKDQTAWKESGEVERNWETQGKQSDAAIHCFMTIAVEAPGFVMYANNAVPDSLNFPHDALSTDHTSVGLYQQTEGNGWGTVAQRMNVRESTEMFLQKLNNLNWRNMDRGTACQAVQGSAFPERYAQHEQEAIQQVRTLRMNQTPGSGASPGTDPTKVTLPGGEGANIPSVPGLSPGSNTLAVVTGDRTPQGAATAAGRPRFDTQGAILYAKAQLGKPYVWGATGPAGYDCLAAGTLVSTDRGEVPIEDVTTNDRVFTRKGFKRVLRAWKVRDDAEIVGVQVGGRFLSGTPDHRVWTENRGWTPLEGIDEFDTLVSCRTDSSKRHASSVTTSIWADRTETIAVANAGVSRPVRKIKEETSVAQPKGLSSKESHTTDIRTLLDRVIGFTSSDREELCMSPSGSIITDEKSHQVTRSIMSTTTLSITIRRISPVKNSQTIDEKVKRVGGYTITSVHCAGRDSKPTKLRSANSDSALASTSRSSITTNVRQRRSVYDLWVEDEHEFFAEGVLVHNCSGLTTMAYKSIGLDIGRDTHAQYNGGQKIPAAQAKPGDLMFPENIEHVVMVSDTPGMILEASTEGIPIHEVPNHYPPSTPCVHISGAEWGGVGAAAFNPFPVGAGAAPGTVSDGLNGTAAQVSSKEPIARNLFTYMFVAPPADQLSMMLGAAPGTEEKAFMNDQSMMPTVKSMSLAGLRNFQSLPNGDFSAYYPDYFGLDGKQAVLKLRDIEMKDVKIDLNDDALCTHAYVSGSQMPNAGSTGMLGWIQSQGYATVENEWLFKKMTMVAPTVKGERLTNGKDIMRRFGVRPLVQEMTMIQSGPMEFLCAVALFMQKWAEQYSTQIELTFMPELYPGMRIELDGHGLQVYVSQVTHNCDFDNGFTTTATIMAPSTTNIGKMLTEVRNSFSQPGINLDALISNAANWLS